MQAKFSSSGQRENTILASHLVSALIPTTSPVTWVGLWNIKTNRYRKEMLTVTEVLHYAHSRAFRLSRIIMEDLWENLL